MTRRLPDFLVIGAMKSGTTSLFQWLDSHEDCRLSPVKEPHFFSREERFALGTDSYLDLFEGIPRTLVTGEASASYADARVAGTVARRIHDLMPEVRLVYLVREPVSRLKSHYLHEWQRSRERRPLLDALSDPDNAYVAMSRYADVAATFLEHFDRLQLLVLGTEELAGTDGPGWRRVTDHLGLSPLPGKVDRANVSSTKMAFNPLLLRLWESGALERARRLPAPVRRAGRLLAGRATRDLRRQSEEVAATAVPDEIVAELHDQWRSVRELGTR